MLTRVQVSRSTNRGMGWAAGIGFVADAGTQFTDIYLLDSCTLFRLRGQLPLRVFGNAHHCKFQLHMRPGCHWCTFCAGWIHLDILCTRILYCTAWSVTVKQSQVHTACIKGPAQNNGRRAWKGVSYPFSILYASRCDASTCYEQASLPTRKPQSAAQHCTSVNTDCQNCVYQTHTIVCLNLLMHCVCAVVFHSGSGFCNKCLCITVAR